MNLTRMLALASVICLAPALSAEEPKSEKANNPFVGTYRIMSGERDGKAIPSERLEDVRVSITDESITTYETDEKKVYAATYKLGKANKGEATPIEMTATLTPFRAGKGSKTGGLIKADGETVMLIYALPDGKTPSDFTTYKGQQMFVLKRESR